MIINSLLDNDLYKFIMGQFIWKKHPHVEVEYKFYNRGTHTFDINFAKQLEQEIVNLCKLKFTNEEIEFMRRMGHFEEGYLEFLHDFQFKETDVTFRITPENNLDLEIRGKWKDVIYWEVPLMALISEIFFKDQPLDFPELIDKTNNKGHELQLWNCRFSEFGTRRRYSFKIQDIIINTLQYFVPCFRGTSNLHFVKKYNMSPIGTQAHELYMGYQGLFGHLGLINPTSCLLNDWAHYYKGKFNIALTDTFTTDYFLKHFNWKYARLYDGVRQDSGDPLRFADKMIIHYNKLGINPSHKTIVFSDSLTVEKAIKIQKYCGDNINCQFGIGTHFTNDFNWLPLNIVIKLDEIDGKKVVKLSDDKGKETGDPKMIEKIRHE